MRNYLLRLTVHSSALRVANHHVMHLIVFDMVRSDLTCVSTFAVGAAVLSSEHDSRVHDGLNEGQVQESG